MQCKVTRCIICIFNKVESLNKENSYKNFTKEVMLSFEEIFAMQSRKFWTKFRVIMIVKIEKAPRELKKGILKNYKQKENCAVISIAWKFRKFSRSGAQAQTHRRC